MNFVRRWYAIDMQLAALAIVLGCCLMGLLAQPANAQSNGTWNVDAGGNWSDTSKWLGGTVANGVDATATTDSFFTELPRTITLDTPRTIGNLTFDFALGNWILAGSNTLTMDVTSGTPTITSNPVGGQSVTISVPIAGNDGLLTTGGGLLIMTGNNTYSGTTTISGGTGSTLRATDGVGIPTNSNITLSNGTWETSGTLSRTLGTGNGQLQWTAGGGLAAYGGDLNVQLNGGTSAVTWNAGSFVPTGNILVLNSTTANGLVNFQNGIDLAGGNRTILVDGNNSSLIRLAQISGVLSNGALNVQGSTLSLTGTNTYSGSTTANGGVVRAIDGVGLPTNSNLVLTGLGRLESSGTFSRSLGSGANQVQWTGSGGFSAAGAALAVQLNGGTGEVTWASTPGFLAGGGTFALGSLTANNVVDIQNAINLNGATRSFDVWDNDQSGGDFARISGAISNGGLTKNGQGTLELSATNSYTGQTTIAAGALRAIDGLGVNASSNITFQGTSTTNAVFETNGVFNRTVGNGVGQVRWMTDSSGGFAAQGGALDVQLNGGTGAIVWGGISWFASANGSLVLGSVTADNVVNFQNGLTLASTGGRNVVVVDNPFSGNDFAQLSGPLISFSGDGLRKNGDGTLALTNAGNTYSGATTIFGGALRVGANAGVGLSSSSNLVFNGTNTGGAAVLETSGTFTRSLGAGGGQVQWSSSGGFAAFGGTLDVKLNNNTSPVTWGSGGFVSAFGDLRLGSVTANNVVDFQNGIDLAGDTRLITVYDNAFSSADSAKISGVISNGGLTKDGAGRLTLSGANTYTGTTSVLAGTLELAAAQATTSITVASGATLTGNAGASGATLNISGTFAGNGTYGDLNLLAGSTLAPGNSPGAQNVGNTTITGAGNYNWQIYDATGAAGVGYDTVNVSGTLNVTAASGYNINLWSLSGIGPDVNGNAINWDNTIAQSWKLWQTTGGVVGFNAANFNINTSAFNGTAGFANALASGTFGLGVVGNDLVLQFTPFAAVPEPGSLLLAALAAGPIGFQSWRRRKARRDSTVA